MNGFGNCNEFPNRKQRRAGGGLRLLRGAVAALLLGSGFGNAVLAQPVAPDNVGNPGHTSGGGIRGACVADPSQLAIGLDRQDLRMEGQYIPDGSSLTELFAAADLLAATAPNPTLIARIPASGIDTDDDGELDILPADMVHVLVFDRQGTPVAEYERPLAGDGEPEWLELPVLEGDRVLEPGRDYYVTVSVVCDGTTGDQSANVTAIGHVRRDASLTPAADRSEADVGAQEAESDREVREVREDR